jgi:CSLREA domain-containing protein
MKDKQFHNLTRQRANRGSWWNVLRCLFAGFLVLMLLPRAGSVHAANNWIVTKTDDTNDGVCDSDCSLREAIAVAAPGDTVTVPAGTYALWLNHLFVNKDLTITGSGAGSTIVQQTNPLFRVIDIGNLLGAAPVVSISRLTIKGGHATVPSNSEALPGHEHGGGLHNHGTVTLTNVTFTDNAASDINPLNGTSGKGGGIWNAGSMTLINVTIANNLAAVSGAGIGGIPPTIINTIVANNSPDNCSVTITAGSDNLQFPGTTCGATIPTADPMLGPLTDGVYPLLAGSPAINMGTNSGCPPTDQFGTLRPQGPFCDIGAFEWADVTPPVIVANVTPTPNANGWNNSDVTVTWNISDPESFIDTSSGCGATTLTSETGGTLLICSATNGANLSSSESVTVKIDITPPTVTYTGNAGVYTVDQTVNITCSPDDNLAGLDLTTCADINGPAASFGLGTHSFSAIATDKAGNAGSGSTTFTIANVPATGGDTTGVFRPTDGALYLKNQNTTGIADVQINYGLGGDYPIVGDWDGNGTVTIGIYRDGSFYLRNSNTIGVADIVFPFGTPGDQPIAGDWDGDGIDTIGLYHEGTFFLRNQNSAGAPDATFALGVAGDVGIAGDWDGDGMDTTGVFRPSNGALYLKNQNTTGFADIQINYGIAGDKPVTGDWNDDGVDTIGVYRDGTFYLRNTNTIGFADLVFALGIPGDMPIAGNWDGLP